MASTSRTSDRTGVEGKWYDAGNFGEMHDDLRTHFGQVFRIISNRPVLIKHFQECEVCQSIKEASAAEVTGMIAVRRRMQYEITPSQMAAILGLPPGHQVVQMYAVAEPNSIKVVVMGPGLPEVPETVEAPIKHLRLINGGQQADAA